MFMAQGICSLSFLSVPKVLISVKDLMRWLVGGRHQTWGDLAKVPTPHHLSSHFSRQTTPCCWFCKRKNAEKSVFFWGGGAAHLLVVLGMAVPSPFRSHLLGGFLLNVAGDEGE